MADSYPITFKFFILLVLILAFAASNIEPKPFINCDNYPLHVTIINDIYPDPGSVPTEFTLHCKSKDDDLGFHSISYSQQYEFTFRPSYVFWINTLFFCSFTWQGSPYRHYIDIYSQKRDGCDDLQWKMNRTGGSKWGKWYPWKSIEIMDANSTSKL
ncbi:putative plant self-incompatibility S1 [Medicago truncatula]|uniref:S-protein homolog n=1 Tax=Medicago truncatula TaxID=3880 RepID=G7L4B9_MEDTR|nr:leguminosin group486 secreted peptide [Medicago truncatula]RHN45053.1 putative plant self-incompatibility S1 [Medicago truncatula]